MYRLTIFPGCLDTGYKGKKHAQNLKWRKVQRIFGFRGGESFFGKA